MKEKKECEHNHAIWFLHFFSRAEWDKSWLFLKGKSNRKINPTKESALSLIVLEIFTILLTLSPSLSLSPSLTLSLLLTHTLFHSLRISFLHTHHFKHYWISHTHTHTRARTPHLQAHTLMQSQSMKQMECSIWSKITFNKFEIPF